MARAPMIGPDEKAGGGNFNPSKDFPGGPAGIKIARMGKNDGFRPEQRRRRRFEERGERFLEGLRVGRVEASGSVGFAGQNRLFLLLRILRRRFSLGFS